MKSGLEIKDLLEGERLIELGRAIGEALAATQARYQSPVLGLDEVKTLTGKDNNAVYGWLKCNGITNCGKGRYARKKVIAALEQEAKRGAGSKPRGRPARFKTPEKDADLQHPPQEAARPKTFPPPLSGPAHGSGGAAGSGSLHGPATGTPG